VAGEADRGVGRPVVPRPEVQLLVAVQYQAPTTGLDVVSSSDRSTAALLVIGSLNVSMIGMPTP